MNTTNRELTEEELEEFRREERELARKMDEDAVRFWKQLGWVLSIGGLAVSVAFLFWLGTTGTAYWWKLVAGGVMLGFGAGILGLYARKRWAFNVLALALLGLFSSWWIAIYLLDK